MRPTNLVEIGVNFVIGFPWEITPKYGQFVICLSRGRLEKQNEVSKNKLQDAFFQRKMHPTILVEVCFVYQILYYSIVHSVQIYMSGQRSGGHINLYVRATLRRTYNSSAPNSTIFGTILVSSPNLLANHMPSHIPPVADSIFMKICFMKQFPWPIFGSRFISSEICVKQPRK
jgi:hypothetical protein